jgi:hypothetical protein
MFNNKSYYSAAKGGKRLFIDLYFMNIEITFWKKDVTKMKWSLSYCFKNKVYYLNRMKTGELKFYSSK